MRDYSLGDTIYGNDFDNTISPELQYLHWRNSAWPTLGIGPNLGSEDIYAAGGNDLVSGGRGTDLFDGRAGFDFCDASMQKSETIKYAGFTPTADMGIFTVLPEGCNAPIGKSTRF